MHIILVARSLTRVWRRSINIAEQVYFINQGESLKHKGDERSEDARAAARSVAAKPVPTAGGTVLSSAADTDTTPDAGEGRD